jgi:hypothetical protein
MNWTSGQIEDLKKKYGVFVIKPNCSEADYNDKTLPVDSFVITYDFEGSECMDLVMSQKRVYIFDAYYDALGPGSIKSINQAEGRVPTKVWSGKKS